MPRGNCVSCAARRAQPSSTRRGRCAAGVSEKVAPETVAGTGTIDTYTVNYQAWRPDLEVPYVIARVAIDGAPGVFLTTNIVGCAVDAVEIGDRVRVKFEQQGDVYLPLFEKIS